MHWSYGLKTLKKTFFALSKKKTYFLSIFLCATYSYCPHSYWMPFSLLGSPCTHFWHENWALLTSQTSQKPMKACTQKVLCCCLWAKKLCPFQSWPIEHSNISSYTMRMNLLNWCDLVSISKNVVFCAFFVVKIYKYLADFVSIY